MTEDIYLRSRLKSAILLIITIFVVGVFGYRLIEGWSFIDALYMTVITLATIGYGETHPLSTAGRLFTIFLILSGLGIMGYGLSILATFIVEGELVRVIGRRKMEKAINKLNNHIIICGAGETGRYVVEEFIKTKTPFVIVESDPTNLESLQQYDGILYIRGDATKDAILIEAGIRRAKGLVSALHSDKDNLFVVLTARALNSKLHIVSRVVESDSEHKLIVAGANDIVSPKFIGGMRMASIMIRPAVVSFLDIMLREEDLTLRLEEVPVVAGSKLVGVKLRESEIRKTGLIVVAIIIGATNKYTYNPNPDTVLQAGDTLIVMGDVEQVRELRQQVMPKEPALRS